MLLSQVATDGQQFFNLVPLVVFIPLAGLLVNLIFGRWFGEKLIGAVASAATGLAFVVAVLLAISLAGHPEGVVVPLARWISVGSLEIGWGFQVDTLSVTMMLVVSGVGALIHIYAIGYMHDDVLHNGDPGRYRRFFVYFNLFIVAMMILVSADNYMMLFVGWEGVGLCSYLLIGFWFEKGENGIGNSLAAKKAFITNRIGDFGFLLAAFTMFGVFRTFNFEAVFSQVPGVAEAFPTAIIMITVFMLLGVAGKSAQIPLYVWLPDAMAGPTPVSALIHAATMVTAGVYLVARSYPLYAVVPVSQNLVAIVGGLTALFAATIGVAQFDIKKVLAYSTISQLGFMVAAVGMGAVAAGIFHLVAHAFFKALLFLAAGSVIQGVERGEHEVEHDPRLKKAAKSTGHSFDPQDMRNMGGMRGRMKITFWVYLIGALALSGIPPLAGFFSKDEILLEASHINPAVYYLLLGAAFFTAFYMGRQVLMVFFGEARSEAAAHASESRPLMTIPLIILAFFSAFGGLLNLPVIHTLGHWLEHTIKIEGAVKQVTLGEEAAQAASGFDPLVAAISTVLALTAIALAWYIYDRRYKDTLRLPRGKRPDDPLRPMLGPVFKLLENKYWVDELYRAVILNPYVWLSRFLAEQVDWRFWHNWFHDRVIVGGYNALARLLSVRVDLGIIDAIANGLGELTKRLSGRMRLIQTGYVRNYALSVFLGVVIILGYLILR
jgi:NADH-quinone oxidoreductase subunit L